MRTLRLVVAWIVTLAVSAGAQSRHAVNGSELSVGADLTEWSDGREPWREPRLAFRRNTARGAAIVRLSHVGRVGLRDDRVEVEAYPLLRGGYAALGASYASNGVLYARSTVSAELYATLPAHLEGSLGYRRLNFATPVNVGVASLGWYYREFLFGTRVNHAGGGARGTSTTVSARRYFGDDGQFVGALASAGSLREDLRSAADLASLSSRSIGGQAELVFQSRWLLNAKGSIGRDELMSGGFVRVSMLGMSFGLRF